MTSAASRVGFLGPPGTFTAEALRAQADLAGCEHVPLRSMPEVLAAVEAGEVELGFVALENSIEGTVNITLDNLIFERNLLIQREVVMAIRMNLCAPPGVGLSDIRRVVSIPHALAQCRDWFAANLAGVEEVAANSTSEAVRAVGEADPRPIDTAAVGTALAAELYGLNVLAQGIEDHSDNSTRFVLVARDGIPAPTGHDKTSIVCFQHADAPGSLHSILGQFSARNLNLTKLESRPTKRGLGDYCFIVDLEGHVDDEVVADCLRDLHASLAGLKFLGSYPAAGDAGPAIRRDAEEAWRSADEWISSVRSQVRR
jgi:prephenate dehydratase